MNKVYRKELKMTAIMRCDLVTRKTPKGSEYMEALVDPAIHGNDPTVLACKRAFDGMSEDEELVMTWKYPDYLYPQMGEVIEWRVQKARD
jgi:hypothetical protein